MGEKPIKKVSIKELIRGSGDSSAKDEQSYCIEDINKPTKTTKNATNSSYKSYYEKLRDPRWQQKRLRVMERDNFMCKSCGSTEKSLNVHHAVPYRKNTEPWEYEIDELITLCEDCHGKISEIITSISEIVMGRCRSTDSANEMYSVIMELDGLDPYQLRIAHQLLKIGVRGKIISEHNHE